MGAASALVGVRRIGLAVLAVLATAISGPASSAADSPNLAPYFAPAGPGAEAPDHEGFVRRWLLLEPISKPNRSNAGFTGSYVREALTASMPRDSLGLLPHAGAVETVDASPLTWRALDATRFDVKLFNFALALKKPIYGVIFWAATEIDAPRDMRVRLAVGSNSASMWWVNGQEAVDLFGDRRMVMDDVVSAPIVLHKGRNVVRGAVINGPGLSDFCLRFIDDAGQPVTGLRVRAG